MSFDECDCMCHDPDVGLSCHHIMACCYTCPKCHARIKSHACDFHEKECSGLAWSQEDDSDNDWPVSGWEEDKD